MNEKIIENIKQDKYNREELENLYANAERLGHDDVLAAAKNALKGIDSRSYSKRFIKPIRDKVLQITREIAEENGWGKWEDNKVGNGIKVGGPMMNGEELAEYYVSYRHPSWKSSSYLAVFQHDEEGPVKYKIKPHDGEEQTVDTSDEAIALFCSAITM